MAAEDGFRLDGTHQVTYCLQQEDAVPPVVFAPGERNVVLSYEDEYFQLGYAVSGFQEYFAPSRWTASKIQGDGGVDVTGAPNSILVEGANTASVIVAPGSAASYGIAIPAEGYVTFDWSYIGGSNLINQQFWIEVNGERVEYMAENHTAGNFFSGLVFPGDRLSLNVSTEERGFKVLLSNFTLLTNAIGLVERRWAATSASGRQAQFNQLVSIKKPDFTKVVFPGNYDGIEYPIFGYGSSIEPGWSGYPVIDEDGSLATTHDQYPLAGDACSFHVKWEDEMLYDNGICIVFRHWFVSDHCSDNVQEHTQILKIRGGCPQTDNPLPYGQFGIPDNSAGGHPADINRAFTGLSASTGAFPVSPDSLLQPGPAREIPD